jgi:hypothetical protein
MRYTCSAKWLSIRCWLNKSCTRISVVLLVYTFEYFFLRKKGNSNSPWVGVSDIHQVQTDYRFFIKLNRMSGLVYTVHMYNRNCQVSFYQFEFILITRGVIDHHTFNHLITRSVFYPIILSFIEKTKNYLSLLWQENIDNPY